jgi:NADH-quinone oxidoreductase subunit L
MTHAFFKALMFLGAGSVIHGMHHEQDMRKMGALKKYMPYTYWTFLAGWLAICGIIPFSGFWSKDEILWRTASTTVVPIGWILWIVGTIAATCTAFYMTRLVAMTFWGKERYPAHEHSMEHEGHAQKKEHPTPHKHAHIPHESPRSMWMPLVVLAILATIGGFVGVSTAFTGGKHVGGKLNIVNWMEPIIWNPSTGQFGRPEESKTGVIAFGEMSAAEAARVEENSNHAGFNLAHAVEARLGSETATEWVFIVISLIVAGLGIGLGLLFYIKSPNLADLWATRLRPLYEASYHKYWIDEIYGWAITRRTMDLARAVFAFDSKVVDGGVNGSAWFTRLSSLITGGTDIYFVDGIVNAIANFVVRLMSPIVRAAQTGFTQNYALVMVIGLLVAVAFYLIKVF